ncbi:MAG TPA: lipoyl(octanoyl) transferase LipB [Terriglobales bacterium]|nr:lipoyl(octanoyl) transferase LipB [Terriglobales bacterium]
MPLLQVLDLGLTDYATALKLQQTLVELRKHGRIADTLLLLEHPPVITLGRNSRSANIVASPEFLAERGVEVFEINRGGDVTFHGPGQIVGYSICDLRALPTGESGKKIGPVEFVRRLEEALIRTCADFDIAAQRVPGLTGVWTHGPQEKKLAAIGVHISRGVTSHGFALNMTTDLESFKLIIPCGISDKSVTSMEEDLGGLSSPGGKKLETETVQQSLARQFGNVFGTQILWLESLQSLLASQSAQTPQDTPLKEPDDLKKMREELEIAHRDDVSWG